MIGREPNPVDDTGRPPQSEGPWYPRGCAPSSPTTTERARPQVGPRTRSNVPTSTFDGATPAQPRGGFSSARAVATTAAVHSGRRNPNAAGLQETIEELIRSAQSTDKFVTDQAWRERQRNNRPTLWAVDPSGLLRYNGKAYVPRSLVPEILNSFHDDGTAGHLGARKTKMRVRQYYYWPGLAADVDQHVKTCDSCQRTKPRRHAPYGFLASLPTPARPFQEISLDFVTGLPPSTHPFTARKHDAILVIVDRFTKYALYVPTTKTLTSSGFAELFFYHVFRPYGLPDGIVSDRDSLFTSNFWTAVCKLLDTSRRLSTAYHPQTDGQTERQNQSLEHYLRAYCNWHQSDWASLLTLAEWTYNTSIHSATNASPASLLLGYQPKGPNDVATPVSAVPAADDRVRALLEGRTHARELLRKSNETYARWYDRKRTDQSFQVGDWVLLSTKNLKQRRPSRKLSDRYIGPYQVTRVMSSGLAFELDLPPSLKQHNVFPISSLEPFHGTDESARSARRRDDVDETDVAFEVDAILNHRGPPDDREFLIHWKGYPSDEDSWEPLSSLDDGPLLRQYLAHME